MKEAVGLQIQNLTKSFGPRKVLRDVSLKIEPGSFVSLLGPSGCGKSTLLRLIADLDSASSGQILGTDLDRKSMGFVFQEAELLPWRTVRENIHLPFELLGQNLDLSAEQKNQRIQEALKQVQLENSQDLLPQQLSGGMKMRVSLARALVTRPRLLLLDEPFSALDEDTRFQMQDLLRAIWAKEKMTILFVTHSLSEATYLSERVIRWNAESTTLLDRSIEFSLDRTAALRTSVEFNQTLQSLEIKNSSQVVL